MESLLFYHQSSISSYQRLVLVSFQIVSPVCWIIPRIDPLEPISLIPYQKNKDLLQGTIMRPGIISLLISLFVILLDNYLLVMKESPHIVSFKETLSTTIQRRVLFVLITKSHLEAMIF